MAFNGSKVFATLFVLCSFYKMGLDDTANVEISDATLRRRLWHRVREFVNTECRTHMEVLRYDKYSKELFAGGLKYYEIFFEHMKPRNDTIDMDAVENECHLYFLRANLNGINAEEAQHGCAYFSRFVDAQFESLETRVHDYAVTVIVRSQDYLEVYPANIIFYYGSVIVCWMFILWLLIV